MSTKQEGIDVADQNEDSRMLMQIEHNDMYVMLDVTYNEKSDDYQVRLCGLGDTRRNCGRTEYQAISNWRKANYQWTPSATESAKMAIKEV